MSEIAPAELKARLEAAEPVSIVDIRQETEFRGWHIPGAQNLPVYEALRRNDTQSLVDRSASLPKDRSVVAVCKGGVISRRAAEVLRSLGFDALSLSGGMRSWGAVWSVAPIELPRRPEATCLQIRRSGKGCLSYLVGDAGEAAVVDPSVDVEAYTSAAARAGLRITRVLETHVHADHLSRARELCRAVGAELRMPPTDRVSFPFVPIADGESITVGGLQIEAIATPGHTSESCCYLVDGTVLLTGDTLFPDAVGRPDLERGDEGAEAGARMLHDSLRHKLLARFDDAPIYAAHHSAPPAFDGRPIGGSLGAVRGGLPLLALDEREFVERIVSRLGAKPGNYGTILAVNEGRSDLGGADPLDVEAGPNCCAAGG